MKAAYQVIRPMADPRTGLITLPRPLDDSIVPRGTAALLSLKDVPTLGAISYGCSSSCPQAWRILPARMPGKAI